MGRGGTRIGKGDHARILHLADVEKRQVAEIAAEYGCKPATMSALLGKLRRAAPGVEQPAVETAGEQCAPPVAVPAEAVPAADLFAAAEAVQPPPPAEAALPARSAVVTELPRGKRGGIGASLAKPGFGLAMRTADGEESMTPFRSLEDLLSAVKPILRASARSPDAVWFSIKPVDLSALEYDAA